MYFSKYQKPFTLSSTRFTHFTLKIYAKFFYAFYPLLFYVLRFLPTAWENRHFRKVTINTARDRKGPGKHHKGPHVIARDHRKPG